jgi:hypothetical protein
MPHRVSPTDRVRGHIDELFASDRPIQEILEEVARLGAQLLMQVALEAEITAFLAATATSGPRPARTPGPAAGTDTGR